MITSPTKKGVVFIANESENEVEKHDFLMELSEDSKGNLEWTITKNLMKRYPATSTRQNKSLILAVIFAGCVGILILIFIIWYNFH